jgi:dienelactone hydrolase
LLGTDIPAEPGAIKAKILVCHGDADPLAPRAAVTTFWEEMDHAGADWHFHSYGKVKHGFTDPEATIAAIRQCWAMTRLPTAPAGRQPPTCWARSSRNHSGDG